jgi:hypothetical protein
MGTPAVAVSGHFAIGSGTTCTNGLSVLAAGTCIINVVFKPTAVGFTSGTLSVFDSDVTSPQTVALSGTGTAIKFSPGSVNFGTVTRGVQVSTPVTLTNAGTTTVTLNGFLLTGANSADFVYSAPCGPTLGAGQSCSLTMYFDPSKVGAEKATFKVYDNAAGSPQTLSLSGTGQ